VINSLLSNKWIAIDLEIVQEGWGSIINGKQDKNSFPLPWNTEWLLSHNIWHG